MNLKISSADLDRFLNDIHTNIDDEASDFQKLLVYLFSFANDRLIARDDTMILRLLSTIEFIVSKKKRLFLTGEISPSDINAINIPHTKNESVPIYHWCIVFALHHLHVDVVHLKGFIINVVNLIVRAHHIRSLKVVKSKLLEYLLSNIDYLLANLTSNQIKQYQICIFKSVHLFTIINDYDISEKLVSLNPLSLQSMARKFWFLLNQLQNNPNRDELMSLLILNFLNNISITDSLSWNQIALLQGWIIEYLELPLCIDSHQTTHVIAFAFLKLYSVCIRNNIVESFINFTNFRRILLNIPNTLPHEIRNSLHIINYHYNLATNNQSVISQYQTSPYNEFLTEKFDDFQMEELKNSILDIESPEIKERRQILKLLDYVGAKNSRTETKFTFLNWIQNVKRNIKSQNISRPTQYSLLTALGHYCCVANEDFNFVVNECTKCGSIFLSKNCYNSIDATRKPFVESKEISILYNDILIAQFLNFPLENDPLLCCNFLLTVYKVFSSYRPAPNTELQKDTLFRFLIHNLSTNSNRDVRLLISYILPLYLIQPRDNNTDANFKTIFRGVSSISFAGNRKHFGESSIKILVNLAIVSDGEWLCVLFIKLIDLLGEENDQLVNYVYNGFLNIASAKSIALYKLLSPYLPSIAEVIIKSPRIFEKVTELLGVTKNFFLSRTKEYTTPRFLEYYKYDFIQVIADASNMTKWELVAKNLPRIVATYLVRDIEFDEKYFINVLSNVNPKYKSVSMKDLMSRVGEITWFILLQIQIDEVNDKFENEDKIINALQYVAKMSMKQKEIDRPSKNFDFIEYHLGEHVLLLVQKFSETVHQIKGTKPYLEKVSSLRAIEFLINKNIHSITIALGQISTCLQASLEIPNFQVAALRCWNGLVQNLPPEHLISLIDIVISLILQKFKTFEVKSKEIAIQILQRIYQEIQHKYNKFSLYFLSIPFLDYLKEYNPVLGFKNVKNISKLTIFQEFTRRLQTSNEYVVQQALCDLLNYCQKYQMNCQTDIFRDVSLKTAINQLIQTLLDTSAKFRNKNDTIPSNCARVLSVIGSLDSNKFEFKSFKSNIIILHDFKDYKENSDFLMDFIESSILKIFWASRNPMRQLFYAYAMQSFLKVMKLNVNVLNPSSQDYFTDIWNKFSDVAKSTLTPLLSSSYIAPPAKYEAIKYPIYHKNLKYENWLVQLTSDLLKRPLNSKFDKTTDSSKLAIFQTCSIIIKDQDISLCQYLLKYVTLSHIINGNEMATSDLKSEFLAILKVTSSTCSPDRIELLNSCYHTVFEVLDYISEWVSTATQYLNKYSLDSSEASKLKKHIKLSNTFLSYIPMDLIAVKSAECDSYERTILYLEKCYREGKVDENFKIDELNFVHTLQSMYSNLNDFDALSGVLQKFSTNNLSEKLSTFQYDENWSLAQQSFQVLSNSKDAETEVENTTKLLKSLSEHGLYDEALTTLSARCDLSDLKSISIDWSMVGLQASVFSGHGDQINKWLCITDSIGKPKDVETLITYELAKGIKFLFDKNINAFESCMTRLYLIIGNSLVLSMSSSFSRNLNLMNQLHSIYDLKLLNSEEYKDETNQLKDDILNARLSNIDQTFETQWKVLTLQRVSHQISELERKVSSLLLHCSSLARKQKRLDLSTQLTIRAMGSEDSAANSEYARLLWAEGQQTEAIKSLAITIEENPLNAELQLQYAKWLDESNHLSSHAIICEYNKAILLEKTWENPYYDLGKYYNKIMDSSNDKSGYFEQQTVRHFLKALAVGSLFIFEALPKSITIWLDFAQRKGKTRDAERRLNQIVEDIKKCIGSITNYAWYTAITQILSRIVHEHKPSFDLLAKITSGIIKDYPRHSLWYVLSHSSSNDEIRRNRINQILQEVQNSDSSYGTIIESAQELFESLIKIAKVKISKSPRTTKLSLSKDFKVSNLFKPHDALVIPVRSNLEIRLPANKMKKFNAFPKSASITFDGFDDVVNIFFSLQMPRQVTVRGSDNKPYRLMVKRDDTRKDAKVVEFTTMINRILLASNEARKRGLSISNYSVVPLTENMGVIEFVVDVQTLKGITSDQRRRMGKSINDRKVFMKLDEAQKLVRGARSSTDTSLNNLVKLFEQICNDYPPVLHQWFINQFSDPSAWYSARNLFIRSSAVMSMVGYIIGLGDRHCENILFFKKTGSVLHIDFDCLFDKGATLPTPEIVPFRLTQNMVDAMGICGIEGSFRLTCEVTGTLLREHEAPLMNILETLLYDPLLDWKSVQNPEAHLSKVRRKIMGLMNEKEGLPMNVHGQVDLLIQEATSVERLAQMYGGWAAYI
jgi:cell cycle checkpoint protein MEC1